MKLKFDRCSGMISLTNRVHFGATDVLRKPMSMGAGEALVGRIVIGSAESTVVVYSGRISRAE